MEVSADLLKNDTVDTMTRAIFNTSVHLDKDNTFLDSWNCHSVLLIQEREKKRGW